VWCEYTRIVGDDESRFNDSMESTVMVGDRSEYIYEVLRHKSTHIDTQEYADVRKSYNPKMLKDLSFEIDDNILQRTSSFCGPNDISIRNQSRIIGHDSYETS
jgi:hypothetical protein